MPMRVRAKAPDLKQLARDLKAAGRRDLQKELYAGLNRATKPLRAEIKANALATLPSEGGLAALVANANINVRGGGGKVRIVAKPKRAVSRADRERVDRQNRAAEATKGLTKAEGRVSRARLGATSAQDLQRINDGTVRHPTYGHAPTVTQRVPPKWFDAPIEASTDDVVEELLDAIDTVAAKLADG